MCVCAPLIPCFLMLSCSWVLVKGVSLCVSGVVSQYSFYVYAQYVYCPEVFASLRDDDVGMGFGGLYELCVHGFEYAAVSVDDFLGCASALYDVALDDAYEALVGVGFYIDSEVHHLAQPRVVECHDAFYDDDFGGFYEEGLRGAVAREHGVYGLVDAFAAAQLLYVAYEEFPVEGVGVVEVFPAQLFEGHSGFGALVVGVLWYDGYVTCMYLLDDFVYDGGLSRPCAACYADDDHGGVCLGVCGANIVLFFYLAEILCSWFFVVFIFFLQLLCQGGYCVEQFKGLCRCGGCCC